MNAICQENISFDRGKGRLEQCVIIAFDLATIPIIPVVSILKLHCWSWIEKSTSFDEK